MIHFIVTGVNRRSTSQVQTVFFTYGEEGKQPATERKHGAEWEEVEFIVEEETKPKIQVANISGDAFLVGQPCKLIVNNPELFGTFKIGQRIPFMPPLEVKPT